MTTSLTATQTAGLPESIEDIEFAMLKGIPSGRMLRCLLQDAYPQAAQLDRFVQLYFPERYGNFADGMDRNARMSTLLDAESHHDVWCALTMDLLQRHQRPAGTFARLAMALTRLWAGIKEKGPAAQHRRRLERRLDECFPGYGELVGFCKAFLPEIHQQLGPEMSRDRIKILILGGVRPLELERCIQAAVLKGRAGKALAGGAVLVVVKEGVEQLQEHRPEIEAAVGRIGEQGRGLLPPATGAAAAGVRDPEAAALRN